MVQENRVIVICGATASGKSELAIKLAQELNTEIISADSLAIYKKLDIGTAKPSEEERKLVKHHLIDCVDEKSSFSVGDYENLAMPILKSLLNQGKIPIICGGTGFYINSLIYDLSYGNAGADEQIREKYKKIVALNGNEYLYSLLKSRDYESSLKISPNDVKRVIRALEIYDITGKRKSEILDDKKPRFPFIAFMPEWEREELYSRINLRVDLMLKKGLIEEVKGLISDGLTRDNQCMQGIGYKETYEAIISGDYSNLAETIKQNTRRYAKRQITFFKKFENLNYIRQNNYEQLKDKVNKWIK